MRRALAERVGYDGAMWSRTEYEAGDRIPVADWGSFRVERAHEAVGASTLYDGYFGEHNQGWRRTVQAVNTGLVPFDALERFESKVLGMTGLSYFATRHVEGLHGVDTRPDLRLVIYDGKRTDAVPLRRFLRLSAPKRAMLAWHVAHVIFGALAEIHDLGLVHDEITLDTILVRPYEASWRRLLSFHVLQTFRFLAKVSHFDDSVAPSIFLRGFALDRLLGNRGLDEAHAAPERLAGYEASPASDIYSVGIVLHELLSGQCHRPGRAPEPLDQLGHAAPRFVAALVMRALDPSAASRPSDASDWAQAFQEAFLSEPETLRWMGPIIWRFPELE